MQQFLTYFRISIFLSILITTAMQTKSPSLLRYLLGSKPVSESIQQCANRADEATDSQTPVLAMNRFGKLFGYSTFNWFSTTWVDEQAAQNICSHGLTWQLIHEKWHSFARHDVRRILGSIAIIGPLFTAAIEAYVHALKKSRWNDGKMGTIPFIDHLIPKVPFIFLALMLFSWHEEYCENAADQYADRITAYYNAKNVKVDIVDCEESECENGVCLVSLS